MAYNLVHIYLYIYKEKLQNNYNFDGFKLLYIKNVVVKDNVQKGSTCGIYR